jgi:hypothetical protein
MAPTVATQPSVTHSAANSPKTTAWAGAAIALGAMLTLLIQFGYLASADLGAFLLATSPADLLLADLLFVVAAGVLAFGWPGERSVVGTSVAGKAALIAFGVLPFLHTLLLFWVELPPTADGLWLLRGNLALGIALLGLAAGVVAGAAVLRARVLRGVAGSALVIVAVWEVLFFATVSLPNLLPPLARDQLIQSWNPGRFIWVVAAGTLLRLVWGVSYLLAARAR